MYVSIQGWAVSCDFTQRQLAPRRVTYPSARLVLSMRTTGVVAG